jgi:hypothetical protein
MEDVMKSSALAGDNFSIAYYLGDRKTGSVHIVTNTQGDIEVKAIPCEPESNLEKSLKPIFIGLAEDHRVITLDPQSKQISFSRTFPGDAFPAHVYSDPKSNRDWFMNDGDKETGNDTLNCGDKGSSVTVIENTASSNAKYLATVCVGRGHHQANFSYPSAAAPQVPYYAYISNLKDGSLSVVGNDPEQTDHYLKVVATINLCEPEKEEGMDAPATPNNSFPHGLVYSPVSGKVYNLNNGYGTIAVIDPLTNTIVDRLAFKGYSNLFLSPCGRYVIGRGADRKSDPNHVIAKLAVMDVTTQTVAHTTELSDIYISKYYFNPEGGKLYLTTSSSGSPEQLANLKTDSLLIFDMTSLPEMKLLNEIRLGVSSGSLDFLAKDTGSLVFSSNSAQGALVVIDGNRNEVIETIDVAPGLSHSRAWLL